MESVNKSKTPLLFINHGAPNEILNKDSKTTIFLNNYQQWAKHTKPKAILIISAHWEEKDWTITTSYVFRTLIIHHITYFLFFLFYYSDKPLDTIYDFYGFEQEMYKIKYPASTSSWLIEQVTGLFKSSNTTLKHDNKRGLDHGSWTILKMMYPDADVPVVQLSIKQGYDGSDHYNMGKILTPLRDQDVLVVCSGSTVHNLRAFFQPSGDTEWAKSFEKYLEDAVGASPESQNQTAQQLESSILAYNKHTHFRKSHPSEDHLMPLIVAAGVAHSSPAKIIHRDWKIVAFPYTFYQWDD
ncbi:hypothetical protein DFA_06559 [Cavenderia fasciculata]|uniref:Extradiol ring-cleavage dioxygenase class III enzyme subunit B domain-containing protein n=1 Tax=Cavenderia fasciculata TaxID=261658 RepID=F4PJC3_CACFS|nr:uncharacterized protein DFA_06559 [Cavenderia fasciculata]EGG24409.1 hypothetical protein DFA_06559 [Cavenderia fasciculata]|eukprot:XP_004362260.1 hypothetical protein DFA_06559 [Cavenderia fasciculata]